jgi:rare lipoprotein A (peptidoglycan hydrolase)
MPTAFLKLAAARASLACAILATAGACHRPGATKAGPVPAASAAPLSTPGTPSTPGTSPVAAATPPPQLPDFQVDAVRTQHGLAAWYDVPAGSLPERRAWPEEMTAASDSLALETYARVTRLENGKSVIVRITDRGIHKPGTIIDLDRTAGEALGMIRAGQTRVKVEALALRNVDARGPSPKASAETSPPKEPGASAAQEKAHAEEKPGGHAPP